MPPPTEPGTSPAAILWDMDGTLVDTEPYWMLAETELVSSWGERWTHADGLGLVGMGLWDSAAILQSRGVGLSADEIVDLLTDRVGEQVRASVPWRPGARELLREVRNAGIPTAMVTMSVRRMATEVADAVGFEAFDVLVAGDEVHAPKPDPAPYLRAAELLGVDIADCVAFEDSLPGIASAAASGAVTIGLPLHAAIPESPRYVLWPGLQHRTLADVIEVFGTHRPSKGAPEHAAGGAIS